jgi:long-chain acyl-CoA synthetase
MLEYNVQNFYEIVERNARERPRQTMIFVDKTKVSNSDLKVKVDKTAAFLKNFGIQKGDVVSLIVANGEEFVVAFLAITKIGAISVPVNTFLKHEEFEHILNDCGAKLLFSSPSFAKETKKLLASTGVGAIIWTEDYATKDDKNISYPDIIAMNAPCMRADAVGEIDDLACIIYTSGTTGKPKGAMLSYRNMLSNMVAAKVAFAFTRRDRFIVYLPMFHSFTLTVMVLLPLYFGCSIVLVRSVFPFANILKQVLLRRVTVFMGVPTIYNALIKAKIPWYFMLFNRVRLFISGSAPLSEKSLIDFKNKFRRGTLLEGYGLSECSPAVAVNRVERQKPLSVGLPLPSYEIKIVDEEMMELPTGEVGEIIVRGDCAMKGYLNHPDATAETLINGWVKTGDLGRLDEDGFVFIVDRKKDLIISKGINIYPREIEEVLYQLEGVATCAVIGIRNDISDEDVVAFVEYKDDAAQKLDEVGVKQFLKKHLANFKLPKHVYFSNELPKNATGKVLKRVLKEQVANMHLTKEEEPELL